jgi:hypothetical protein
MSSATVTTLLEEIKQRNLRDKELREARVPRVGILYVIDPAIADPSKRSDPELFMSDVSVREAESYADLKTYDRVDHYGYWNGTLRRMLVRGEDGQIYKNKDYDFFPRGRVVYDTKEDLYYLYLDRCLLKDQGMVSEIISAMYLPRVKVSVKTDPHYKCRACNRHYVDVTEDSEY